MKNNFYNNKIIGVKNSKSYKKYFAILLISIILLLLSNFATAWFWFKKDTKFSGIQYKYDLLNPARKFFKQEDLIINLQPLRDYLNDQYEADPNISIYFEYLPTGANIAISKDAEFYPASLLKVPVAMAVAKKIEKGDWKWSNELVLMSADKDDKFGTLYKEKINSAHTIEDLVRRSLRDSDNTAHFILVRNLEVPEIEDVYDHMGLKGFLDSDGKLSAKRYSTIFRSLYNSSYLTDENSQKLLSFLAESPFSEFIKSALPEDTTFAHKIGISVDEKVFLDAGIIYPKNRPYILTIMVKKKNELEARSIMRDVSEKVYNFINNYTKNDD